MLYIDLCMVHGHPIVLANSMVMASKELIAHMVTSTDAAEVYALKNCVIDLCHTVLYFVSTYANPISQLKYSIHVIRLVKKANQILAHSVRGQTLHSVNSNYLLNSIYSKFFDLEIFSIFFSNFLLNFCLNFFSTFSFILFRSRIRTHGH